MTIRPVDLPMLRDDAIAHMRQHGPSTYQRAIEDRRQNMTPFAATPARAAQILVDHEIRRLTDAQLFHVDADMTDLAIAAGKGLPEFSLMPEDLPAPAGLIVFAKPIHVIDYAQYHPGEGESAIVAASWGQWTGGNPKWTLGGIWITWWADRDFLVASAVERGILDPRLASDAGRGLGRLMPDNETQSPYSPDPLPVRVGGDDPISQTEAAAGSSGPITSTVRWTATLKATWLLMAQTLADVGTVEHDRAARRRFERQGQEPPTIRVIRLRRSQRAGGPSGESDREYHHRWIVRGHWRQQWYPAREVHRPLWIAPHLKGPDDAPLIGGEKVYTLTADRQVA